MKSFHCILFVFIIVVILSLIPQVSALEIKLGKQSYLAGETFLAEINGDFTEQLAVKNIFFYKDSKEIEPAFYIMQISKQQYFVWVDLMNEGNYSFAIKNVLYKENGILKGDTKQAIFEVKPSINYFYQSLIQSIKTKGWQSAEENALALIALAYDDSLASEGRTALLSKSKNSGECWPSESCNVKETALAAMALSKINAEIKKDWFIDSQNNLDIGLWNLQINSAAQECKLLINTATQNLNLSQGINTIELDLKDKSETVTVKLNCSVNSAKIIHTYLGRITEFPLENQGSSSSITLNNKKCFGKGYRTECDIESTAYAALALKSINAQDSDAVDWLKKNAQTTKEKAIGLYLSSSTDIENWLLNNQHVLGYWSSKALLEDTIANYESTVFAVQALEKEKQAAATTKGEIWLKNNFASASLKEKALALAFVFKASEIEPILSISPAALVAKTNTTISIEISNKAVLPVDVSAQFLPFKTKQSLSIAKSISSRLEFAIPTKIGRQEIKNDTRGSIELSYKTSLLAENSYSIPVIILPAETEIPNQTIEIPANHFRFSASEINATLFAGEETLIPIELRDFSHYVIKDISFIYSRDLKDILNITPSSVQFIDPGEYAAINLTFKSNSIKNVSGFIEATASLPIQLSAKLPISITFTKNASSVSIKLNYTTEEKESKKCQELNGTVCKGNLVCSNPVIKTPDAERCCVGKCKSKINITKIVGIIMIIITVVILAVFIIIGLRKPKKQSKDIYEEIEKKYAKFGK